jgi:aerobic carbon-monoxide dehydrogenase small subunit
MTTLREITLTVNDTVQTIHVEPRRLLAHCLRYDLDLTGTHVGCETAQCGACTVVLNGEPVKSCNMLAVQADGGTLVTIEGLAQDDRLHPIQEAFCEKQGVQCGFCTPGMIMLATTLLQTNPHPNEDEIRRALYGNLCRCTGYQQIIDAIQYAGNLMATKGAS